MSDACAQVRISLGVYLLGALEPGDRAVTEAHLADCPACREELVALAGLPGLLGRLSLADVAEIGGRPDLAGAEDDPLSTPYGPAGPTGPSGSADFSGSAGSSGSGGSRGSAGFSGSGGPVPPTGWAADAGAFPPDDRGNVVPFGRPGAGSPAALARALTQVRRARTATRRRMVAAAAAVALVAAGVSAGVTVAATGSDDGPAGRMLTASDTVTRVGANVWVANVPAGSAFTIRLWGVPPGSHCVLVAQAVDGHRETAASWSANYHGYVNVRGTSGIAADQLARLLVVDDHGRELVDLPARPT